MAHISNIAPGNDRPSGEPGTDGRRAQGLQTTGKAKPWRRGVRQPGDQQLDEKRRTAMITKFRTMLKDEKGQALAEYGLILALIAVAAVAALIALAGGINTTLGEITAHL